jgi:folate-dependent phosphoribosylglycinamide formyltransferase PurN
VFGIGWFSSGRDKAARDLLTTVYDQIKKGDINALITFVFSNREAGESPESDSFFELVGACHLPLICFSSRKFQDTREKPFSACRTEYDREVMKRLAPFHHDLCVLAGYMLIVGPEMCRKYNMINLHPAAPGGPTGSWQDVIWQLIEAKATSTGVMMHLVTPELDRGPVVTYCTFPLTGGSFDTAWQEIKGVPIPEIKRREGETNNLFRLIREEGLAREFPLITATIRAFAEGKVKINAGQVMDCNDRVIRGYNLTGEIEDELRRKKTK